MQPIRCIVYDACTCTGARAHTCNSIQRMHSITCIRHIHIIRTQEDVQHTHTDELLSQNNVHCAGAHVYKKLFVYLYVAVRVQIVAIMYPIRTYLDYVCASISNVHIWIANNIYIHAYTSYNKKQTADIIKTHDTRRCCYVRKYTHTCMDDVRKSHACIQRRPTYTRIHASGCATSTYMYVRRMSYFFMHMLLLCVPRRLFAPGLIQLLIIIKYITYMYIVRHEIRTQQCTKKANNP